MFCYSQVITDLESAFYLFRGEYPVHRLFHTYLGASLVGLACALTGRPVWQAGLRWWQARFPTPRTAVFGRSRPLPWSVAFASAFLGTYSHVFLDSVMHRDMMPFSPFAASNPMLHAISVSSLHQLCLALGVVGALLLPFRASRGEP
jgi:hypothetical protein